MIRDNCLPAEKVIRNVLFNQSDLSQGIVDRDTGEIYPTFQRLSINSLRAKRRINYRLSTIIMEDVARMLCLTD